jgi:ATP-dependent DNA helicase Rep
MTEAMLNAPQQQAVRYLDGPCLVLAGAGSGKTRVITQKIAHLITHGGFLPSQIAALTFTNKAAREMQERVTRLMPETSLRGMIVTTFHSLGMRILREEAKVLGLKSRFSILDAQDSFSIVQDLAATTDKAVTRRLQQTISLWKNAAIEPDEAGSLARDENEAQAARIFRSYDATLAAYQAVDFDDLITKPMALFAREPEILFRWQSRLRYILVDEVQDTNVCQYRLLRQLVGPRAQMTAVGDDDQAIYAWRGATVDNLRLLANDYPNLKVIKLEQNYRSTGRILAAANALIANNPKLFEKRLWSELGPGEAIDVSAMNDDEHEARTVAMRVSAHRFERHATYADYAILYRGKHQARLLEQALRREKVPYVLSGGQSFFERAEIRDVCAWLRILSNEDDDPAFIRAITTPKRGVGSATLESLGAYAGRRHASLFAAGSEPSFATQIDARRLQPITEFVSFVNRMQWRAEREAAGVVLDDLVKAIAYESYLFDTEDARTAQNRWQNVLDFIAWFGQRAAEDSKNLVEMSQSVALLSMLDGKDRDTDAVRLSTLHAAKGLEFAHVFLVGVEEGLLPHHGGDADLGDAAVGERIEEERRLMYVGITRAQRSLHISWCKKRRRGRDEVIREPSRFIAELGLERGPKPDVEPGMTPSERLASLKALLAKPRAA